MVDSGMEDPGSREVYKGAQPRLPLRFLPHQPSSCSNTRSPTRCAPAGKYVPSITHYILQADAMANGYADRLREQRNISAEPPLFRLGGMAIGNGWTGG